MEDLEIRGQVETILNATFFESGQNTEKSAGDLTGLAIPQTLVKDHQLNLM